MTRSRAWGEWKGSLGGKRVGEGGAEKKRSKVQVVCDGGGGHMRGLPWHYELRLRLRCFLLSLSLLWSRLSRPCQFIKRRAIEIRSLEMTSLNFPLVLTTVLFINHVDVDWCSLPAFIKMLKLYRTKMTILLSARRGQILRRCCCAQQVGK